MAASTTPSLSQSLASLIQQQLAQLHSNPALPKYDYSNLNANVIDPQAYATGTANAQYDPQIAALQKQINDNPGQTKLDQSNISDWFGHALNTYNAGAANAAQQYDNSANQLTDSTKGFMSALGGSSNSANQGIANTGQIAQAMLAGNRNADVKLDTNMQGLIPLAEAQAHTNQSQLMGKQLSDLMSQIGAQKGAKGAAYNAALQTGMGQKFSQLSDIDNANTSAAQSLFGDAETRRSDNTSAAAAAMNGITAQMMLPGQLAAQKLANQGAGLSNKYTAAKTKTLSAGVDLNKPGDVQALQSNVAKIVLKSAVNPTTGETTLALNGDPNKMWNAVKGQLSNYKVLSPQGLSVMQNWFKAYLPKGWFFDTKGNLTNNTQVAARAKAEATTVANTGNFTPPSGIVRQTSNKAKTKAPSPADHYVPRGGH